MVSHDAPTSPAISPLAWRIGCYQWPSSRKDLVRLHRWTPKARSPMPVVAPRHSPAVAPVGDPGWVSLRGDNALTLGTKTPALKLDNFFALNPAMPNLHRMFTANEAIIVHAAGESCRQARTRLRACYSSITTATRISPARWRIVPRLPLLHNAGLSNKSQRIKSSAPMSSNYAPASPRRLAPRPSSWRRATAHASAHSPLTAGTPITARAA